MARLSQNISLRLVALAAGLTASVSFVMCGRHPLAQTSTVNDLDDELDLSTKLTEADCPQTIVMGWKVREIKPIRSLESNASYAKALDALKSRGARTYNLRLTRAEFTEERCSYNENVEKGGATASIRKVKEEQSAEDLPRFVVATRLTTQIKDEVSKTRFLSFFTIGTTPTGETVVDNENDDIKQLLTPVESKLRPIGTIQYNLQFNSGK